MPALVAGIHVLRHPNRDVDGRDKPGHDGEVVPTYAPIQIRFPDAAQHAVVRR